MALELNLNTGFHITETDGNIGNPLVLNPNAKIRYNNFVFGIDLVQSLLSYEDLSADKADGSMSIISATAGIKF